MVAPKHNKGFPHHQALFNVNLGLHYDPSWYLPVVLPSEAFHQLTNFPRISNLAIPQIYYQLSSHEGLLMLSGEDRD